MGPKFITYVQT